MPLYTPPFHVGKLSDRGTNNPRGPTGPAQGPAWSTDAGKGVPNSAAEWTLTLAAAGISTGNPGALWLCQEPSGNPADSIGSNGLTAFGAVSYANNVTDWTRKALGLIHTGGAFYNVSIGNTSTTSYMVLAYVAMIAAPVANQPVINVGQPTGSPTDSRRAEITTSRTWRANGGGVTPADGSTDASTTVHPVVLLFNRATSEFTVMTDQDKITTTWVNPTVGGTYFSFGDGTNQAHLLYGCLFSGAAAEYSQAQVKTLLQTLGWTVAWS